MHRMTYRGYDIEVIEEGSRYVISLNGAHRHDATSEDAAMDWIDAERKRVLSLGRKQS